MATPLMNLDLPIVGPGGTPGPEYGTLNNAALTVIDGHDHSPGSGALIKTAGLQVDADLSFRSFNATVMRTAKFDDQVAALGVGDVRAVYVVAGDLYYNNGAGANVRITDGTSINAASIGGIGGDYGTSTANVSYSDTTKTFTFTQDSGIAAHVAVGDVIIFEPVISANGITLQSPSALAGAYAITLPTGLPGTTQLLEMTAAGLVNPTTIVPVLDITTSKINNLGIRNPGDSFQYNIIASAIVADRSLTIPLLTGNDVLVTEAFIQTLTNKTIDAPILANTITGTYTLGGTPTITSPAISGPTLSGTVLGTYTLGGTSTIVTPTIASFVNSAHNHTNAAGGGQITAGGLATGAINLAAQFAAGVVDQAAIGAGEVGQGELKTATSEASTGSASVFVTLAGGEYAFAINVKVDITTSRKYIMAAMSSGNANFVATPNTTLTSSYVMNMHMGIVTGRTVFGRQRYIQACPPYDLGNGEIPLFMFVILLADGTIETTCVAPDPPWGNNGPTNIRPDYFRGGIGFQQRKKSIKRPDDPAGIDAWLENARTAPIEEVEITQELKQSDMLLIPHPFTGNDDLAKKTVVLLEPTGQICADCLDLHEAGESISGLLQEGYLKVENTPIDVAAPPGVAAHRLKWKTTR